MCRCCCVCVCVYLVLNQHGDIDKHVMELFDAAFQPHDVFVTSLNLIQGLLVDLRVHDLGGAETKTDRVRSAEEWEYVKKIKKKDKKQSIREQVAYVAMCENRQELRVSLLPTVAQWHNYSQPQTSNEICASSAGGLKRSNTCTV